ncbi:unnamed protein product [Cochlearia groenlandica]
MWKNTNKQSSLKKIHEMLRYCEENLKKGNLEHALRCAVSVSMSNPNAPEPYAHVAAYRILLAAANNRTVTGEPDYYAVFGIKRGSSSETVATALEERCYEITELLEGHNGTLETVSSSVYGLVSRGVAALKREDRRREYDQRCGFL